MCTCTALLLIDKIMCVESLTALGSKNIVILIKLNNIAYLQQNLYIFLLFHIKPVEEDNLI